MPDADETEARRVVEHARRVSEFLDEDLFKNAVKAVRDQFYVEFSESDLADDAGRRNIRIGLDVLGRVVTALHTYVRDGTVAKDILKGVESKGLFRGR
jgi:glycerol-3-phosphate O-acyltransferase